MLTIELTRDEVINRSQVSVALVTAKDLGGDEELGVGHTHGGQQRGCIEDQLEGERVPAKK